MSARYHAALWLAAKVLNGRTAEAMHAQIAHARDEAKLVMDPAAVDAALADLRVVIDAIDAAEMWGFGACRSTPDARARRVEQQHRAHAVATDLLGAPSADDPPDETAERARAVRAQIESMRKLGEARP